MVVVRARRKQDATNTKNFETDFKVSSQSRKFEFNVFSIIHLNGHNL